MPAPPVRKGGAEGSIDIPLGSDSDNITNVYSRLETMCLAYWAIGGSLYQSATLKSDIITTLDWLNTNP